ncbi:hypothetical protein M0805_009329 [Coniferiporia weirii]|nr:hypothetical protein M0805_009329 [Coniferiporia weirii]
MGNSASSSRAHQDDTVDYGFLSPQGVYTGPRDWNQQVVSQLIVERRLAPFYRPLEEYDESWDDEQILAARKEPPEDATAPESTSRADGGGGGVSASRSNSMNTARRPGSLKEPSRVPEAMVYRDAVECPICFLYYPPNINHSRCCDQAICTECFVQIKRSEPTTTHLVSEPAACPYCVQENFGVTYVPPSWRAGAGAESSHSSIHFASRVPPQQSVDSKGRRKSFGADSAEVVTIDQIRPDWEAKLAAVRAAVARRANRRIIMRQVGDRLIPVGISSGRIHALAGGEVPHTGGEQNNENTGEGEGRGGRRSRRRQHQQQPQDINHLLGTMGLGGQDLEELMVMEAMRLSLLEHEEQQRKETEKKKKEEADRVANSGEASRGAKTRGGMGSLSSAPRLGPPPIPATPPIDVSKPPTCSTLSSDPSSSDRGSSSFGSRPPLIPGSQRAPVEASPSGSDMPAPLGEAIVHSRTHSRSHSGSAIPSPHDSIQQQRQDDNPPGVPLHNAVSAESAECDAVLVLSPAASEDVSENKESRAANASNAAHTDDIPSLSSTTSAVTGDTGAQVDVAPATLLPAHGPAGIVAAPVIDNDSSTSLMSESGEGQSGSSLYDELPSSPDSTISHRPLLLDTPGGEALEVDSVRTAGATANEPADTQLG